MVLIQQGSRKKRALTLHPLCRVIALCGFVGVVILRNSQHIKARGSLTVRETSNVRSQNSPTTTKNQTFVCPYNKLSEVPDEELSPSASDKRHMVDPPRGGKMTLVCCQTTQGPWNILVHHQWAPNGARRFIEMVKSDYFHNKVPLMRCIKDFICQFGLAGAPSNEWNKNLPDDANWLPEGKDHRFNEHGVKRFAQGYLAYAGAGPNTRSNQFIVALKSVGTLAGGSPWSVLYYTPYN